MQELIKVCKTLRDPEAKYSIGALMIYLAWFWPYAHSQFDVFPEKSPLARITNLSSSLLVRAMIFNIEQNKL